MPSVRPPPLRAILLTGFAFAIGCHDKAPPPGEDAGPTAASDIAPGPRSQDTPRPPLGVLPEIDDTGPITPPCPPSKAKGPGVDPHLEVTKGALHGAGTTVPMITVTLRAPPLHVKEPLFVGGPTSTCTADVTSAGEALEFQCGEETQHARGRIFRDGQDLVLKEEYDEVARKIGKRFPLPCGATVHLRGLAKQATR